MPCTYIEKMSKPFKFKQFIIQQEDSLMKVGTDGILLGAWANANVPQTILDIGTGTGLIALMMAQRYSKARVDALEINEASALEATQNIRNSSFTNRVNVTHTSLQTFARHTLSRYDLIVSNPPFFNAGLARNAARHTHTLTHEELVFSVKKLLNEKGQFCLILPKKEGESFIELAINSDLYLAEKTTVKPKPSKPIERLLLRFSNFNLNEKIENELIIEKEGAKRVYTKEFTSLTKAFYLKM